MSNLPAYRKTLVAVVGAVVAFSQIVIYSPAAEISSAEWVTGAILVLTALGVYGTPNEPAA